MGELETSLDSSIVRLHFKINKPLGHLQQWSIVCSFTETLVGVPYEQLTQISHAAVVYFQEGEEKTKEEMHITRAPKRYTLQSRPCPFRAGSLVVSSRDIHYLPVGSWTLDRF